MADLSTLINDIYHVLDEDTDHEPSEENIEWAGQVFTDLLRSRLKARDRKAGVLRFSSLGKPDRQLWYSAHKPELAERMAPKTFLKFLYGDVIEVLLLFLAKESGHDVTDLQKEVNVDGVKGHIDAIIDGTLVDVKSASPYGFKKFADGTLKDNDAFGYIKQISGYGNVLTPDEGAAFLAADKVHGDIALLEVPKDVVAENPPGARIDHLRKVLADGNPPERCYPDEPDGKSGNRKLGVNCSYCPFKNECWKDSNNGEGLKVYQYYGGPRFMTHVEREPRVGQEF